MSARVGGVGGIDAGSMSSSKSGFFRRHAARFLGSLVLTVCVLWALKHTGLELVPSWAEFRLVKWWTVPVYFLSLAAMSYYRGVRWRFLLRKAAPHVKKNRLLAISLVGFAGILLLPFRLGEFVRPALLREKGKVSFSAATGSIISERAVDGLFLSLVLAIALLVVPTVQPMPKYVVGLPVTVTQVRAYGFFTLAGFTAVFVVLAAYFFARDFAKRATLAVFGVVSRPLAERLAGEAERLAHGLDFLRDGPAAAGFLWETTLYWFFNAFGMWLLAIGCGLTHGNATSPTFWEACAIMGMLGVSVLIPGPPGALGIFQAGIFCGITMYYPVEIVKERGPVYACLMFLVQSVFITGSGAAALLSGHTSLKSIAEEENEDDKLGP